MKTSQAMNIVDITKQEFARLNNEISRLNTESSKSYTNGLMDGYAQATAESKIRTDALENELKSLQEKLDKKELTP